MDYLIILNHRIKGLLIIYYINMSVRLLIQFILFYCTQTATNTVFYGSINNTASVQYFSSNISAGDRILNVMFTTKNLKYSNVLMYVTFTPLLVNLTSSQISLYLQTKSPVLTYMDPISTIGGIPQIINVYIPTGATMFYITLFNFNGPEITTTTDYEVQINLSAIYYYCYGCPSGSDVIRDIAYPLSCQCTPCPANYIGPNCKYFLNKLQSPKIINVTNNSSQYFVMDNTGQNIVINIKQITNANISTNSTYLYIQYQYNNRMLAGKLNSYYINQNKSYQYLITTAQKTINIPSIGYNVLLTVQTYGDTYSTVAIIYHKNKEGQSFVIIIIVIVISVVGLIIILGVIYRIWKRCRERNEIVNVNQAVILDQNNLTDKQINKFFPQVLAIHIFFMDINSSVSEVNINQSHNQQQIMPQCSICFDGIKKNDFIRVTYCKHIFHGNCLLSWFHKNPTCPNCRQHFDIKKTKEFRKRLSKQAKSKPDKLIKAILGQNFLEQYKKKGNNNENNIIIQQTSKKVNEIQTQSKNLNIPQNQLHIF